MKFNLEDLQQKLSDKGYYSYTSLQKNSPEKCLKGCINNIDFILYINQEIITLSLHDDTIKVKQHSSIDQCISWLTTMLQPVSSDESYNEEEDEYDYDENTYLHDDITNDDIDYNRY